MSWASTRGLSHSSADLQVSLQMDPHLRSRRSMRSISRRRGVEGVVEAGAGVVGLAHGEQGLERALERRPAAGERDLHRHGAVAAAHPPAVDPAVLEGDQEDPRPVGDRAVACRAVPESPASHERTTSSGSQSQRQRRSRSRSQTWKDQAKGTLSVGPWSSRSTSRPLLPRRTRESRHLREVFLDPGEIEPVGDRQGLPVDLGAAGHEHLVVRASAARAGRAPPRRSGPLGRPPGDSAGGASPRSAAVPAAAGRSTRRSCGP